jgi:A/G-specific adenine glycosylase
MKFFNSKIHRWYAENKRDLPWRNTCNPYFIWLSEIILQQTRIDQGLRYYYKFTNEFPTIQSLANASEDKILKLWQGLGYYSRARNLHFTAKYLVENQDGEFPVQYEAIRSLKGIGDYTAAAIASISYHLEYPVVDGNVYRVLSRFFGISDPIDSGAGRKIFKNLAQKLIKGTDPGMHNQAMMEFGALQCTPQKPDCISCPLNEVCFAFSKGLVHALPVKQKKVKQRDRYFNYFIIRDEQQIWLKKRGGNDIWENLFEFPLIESELKTEVEHLLALPEILKMVHPDCSEIEGVSDWQIHLLTHQRIHYRFIKVRLNKKTGFPPEFIMVNIEDIFNFAVPKLLEKSMAGIYDEFTETINSF